MYFSTIQEGYTFLYAANREQAEKLLPEVDEVITDRGMPFTEDGEVSDMQGSIVAVLAHHQGKPAVMITSHGDAFGLGKINSENPNLRRGFDEVLALATQHALVLQGKNVDCAHVEWILEKELGGDAGHAACESAIHIKFMMERPDLTKSKPRAWEMAWRALRSEKSWNETSSMLGFR